MNSIIKNPQIEFIEKGDTIINLSDFGLSFLVNESLEKDTKEDLMQIEKEGFKTASFPQLIQFLYATSVRAYGHNDFQEFKRIIGRGINQFFGIDNKKEVREINKAKCVLSSIEQGFLTANTWTLYNETGLYIQDFPQIKDGKIIINPLDFQDQLESNNDGVYFNKENTMRFIERDRLLKRDFKNSYLIGLTGSEAGKEMLLKYVHRQNSVTIMEPYLCYNKPENPVCPPILKFDDFKYWMLLSSNIYEPGKHVHSVLAKKIK